MHFNLFNSAILIVKEIYIYFVLDFINTNVSTNIGTNIGTNRGANIGANIYNFFIS